MGEHTTCDRECFQVRPDPVRIFLDRSGQSEADFGLEGGVQKIPNGVRGLK
jgi:hypothetical protein